MPEADRNRMIGSVAAALQVIEILVRGGTPMTLAEIAEKTRRPKSSVHRMLASLINLGYVEHEQSSRYCLTFKLVGMAADLLSSIDIVKASRPHLQALVKATDETAYLAVLDKNGNSIYVARFETTRPVRVYSQLGTPNPAWCTATGRALLAFHPELRDKVLAAKLTPLVPTSVSDPARLRAMLADVERTNCAVTRAAGSPDTGGIAAPIRDFTRAVVASCGIAIPLHRMDAALERKCVPLVVRTANAISVELGMQGGSVADVRASDTPAIPSTPVHVPQPPSSNAFESG
jgi:IclR family transcriptional regulator, KDG regulon repressor